MKITRAILLFSAMLAGGLAFAQNGPPKTVRQAAFKNADGGAHTVTVEGGKVHTSSITLVIRDPNAPATTSTITIDRESRRVTEHDGCPEGGCNLEDWTVAQIWKGTEKR